MSTYNSIKKNCHSNQGHNIPYALKAWGDTIPLAQN